ncbi:MAG: peptidoglycan DD-metalloendopeptidase family protein [Candidatus Coprovivens sp.]
MTKKRLKEWVIPTLALLILIGLLLIYYLLSNLSNVNLIPEDTYFTNVLIETQNTLDVNKVIETGVINPYKGDNITISKYYYNKNEEETRQQQSLIKYENIYMPNTGILYSSDKEFEIVSVLDGKVISIKEDDILGNIIEIEHQNNIITIYQSVKNVKVKVGDRISKGTIIALSGPNKLEQEKENCLHFEVYKEGNLVNPLELLENK